MEDWILGLIGFGVFFTLALLKVHVGLAGALVGFTGLWFILGLEKATSSLAVIAFDSLSHYSFAVIPLFILTGEFAYAGGLAEDAFIAARKWLGSLPGGLGVATAGACGLFATISGSSMATTAVMGRTAYPELIKNKYDVKLAAGIVGCAGTFGILIPPSTALIFYAIFVEQPVGPLFLATPIPAALTVILYMLTIILRVKLNPSLAPVSETSTWKEKFVSLKGAAAPIFVFTIIIGGLYTGFATPSELASIAVAAVLIFILVQRRLTLRGFWQSLISTMSMTSTVFFIILGAFIFLPFLGLTGFTNVVVGGIASLQVDRYVIMGGIILMYTILGMFLNGLAMQALTLPLVFPIIMGLGFNPIWFGIIIVKVMEIGLVTPPLGMNIYVLKTVIKEDISYSTLFSSIWTFLLCDFAVVGFMLVFPDLILIFAR